MLNFFVDKKLASINICTAVWLKQKKLAAFLTYKTFTEYFSNLKQYLNCQVLKIIFQNFTYMCSAGNLSFPFEMQTHKAERVVAFSFEAESASRKTSFMDANEGQTLAQM